MLMYRDSIYHVCVIFDVYYSYISFKSVSLFHIEYSILFLQCHSIKFLRRKIARLYIIGTVLVIQHFNSTRQKPLSFVCGVYGCGYRTCTTRMSAHIPNNTLFEVDFLQIFTNLFDWTMRHFVIVSINFDGGHREAPQLWNSLWENFRSENVIDDNENGAKGCATLSSSLNLIYVSSDP